MSPRPPARRVVGTAARRRLLRWRRAQAWTRHPAFGVGVVLAMVPLGWLLSAALFGGGDAASPGGGALTVSTQEQFTPALARSLHPATRGTRLVVHAHHHRLVVYRRPGGRRLGVLRERRIAGQRVPLVALVERRRARWARIYLPTRPNLALGWVRAADVAYRRVAFALTVELGAHRLTVRREGRVLLRAAIGVGRSVSPTPRGQYFVTDLIRARDPRGLYGPYSFGLSGHSDTFQTFRGGNGQIGLHGTNAPQGLGANISHGCIRVSNRVIIRLARMLPLGTPVRIRA